ncbi:MAG: hypothetical protein KKD98_01235, partial [Candidatus Thermoplasmatota archaeon]|nr:hypothetical protein [Candidatus Thermoplasmatota archaeon]
MMQEHIEYNKIVTHLTVALGIFLIAVIVLLPLSSAQTARPLGTRERYETMPFTSNDLVIPMDEMQNDTVRAFGLVHALLRNDTICYRLIGPPDPVIKTSEYPQGVNYSGGPIIISGHDSEVVNAVLDKFPSVTVHNVTALFISTRVYKIEHPTRILVIGREESNIYQNSFSASLLETMEIPYE